MVLPLGVPHAPGRTIGFYPGLASWDLSRTSGNVQDIAGLAKSGDPTPKAINQPLSFFEGNTQMACTRGKITLVEVVGLDPSAHQGAEELFQQLGLVVYTPEKYTLREDGDPSPDEGPQGGERGGTEFSVGIDVDDHP